MNEKIELLKKWIDKREHDIGTAMIAYRYIPKYKDTIAFQCQHAVEKYLKSFIFYLDLPIKRTHDLIFLLEQINMNEIIEQNWFDKVLELQDFAVEIRYTDRVIDLLDNDIETAIEISQEFRKLILMKLNIDFGYPK